MNTDLNTLLITLYVHLDDRILPTIGFSRDHRVGRKDAARPGYLSEATAATYRHLQDDAQGMIHTLSPGAPAATWQHEQDQRDAHLSR